MSRYGSHGEDGAQKIFENFDFQTPVKVSKQDLSRFEMEFKMAILGLRDFSEMEIHRQLLQKLPPTITRWIVEEEEKQKSHNPIVILTFESRYSEIESKESIKALIGTDPTIVKITAGGYYVLNFHYKGCAKTYWNCIEENFWKAPSLWL